MNRSALLAALIVTTLAAGLLPAPAQANHITAVIPTPNVGATIELHDDSDGFYDTYEFESLTRMLSGYHEWRDYWTVTADAWDEFFLDPTTNRLMLAGDHWSDHQARQLRIPHQAVPTTPELTNESHSDSWTYFVGGTMLPGLPESLLWGRPITFEASWQVNPSPTSQYYHEAESIDIDVTMDAIRGTAHATIVSHSGIGTPWHRETTWELTFITPGSAFADERVRTMRHYDENGLLDHQDTPEPLPLTIVDPGSPHHRQEYRGQSHLDPFPVRDQRHTYHALSDIPTDPEPHPFFDIQAATQVAREIDDEATGAFFARASDPMLTYAELSAEPLYIFGTPIGTDHVRQVHWTLGWTDTNGQELYVWISGIQAHGQDMEITEHGAETYRHEAAAPTAAREGIEIAAPSDLARTVDRTHERLGVDNEHWSWHANAYQLGDDDETPWTFYSGLYSRGDDRVDTDGETGIIRWSNVDTDRFEVLEREIGR